MKVPSVKDLKTITGKGVKSAAEDAVAKTGGVLRLAPNWVPRSFMQPGKRLKLAREDLYALGLNRGGIDERWFASTTEADNFGRQPDEGLSYIVFEGKRFLLRDAVAQLGAGIVGKAIWSKYHRWPVFSKFFDNMGPICHHIHQTNKFAKLVGCDGKPETYYFPPQYNFADDNFPYTFFGLNPDVTKEQVKECMANLLNGDIPLDKPLVLAGIESMSESMQYKVVEFVHSGGRLLVAPDFPREDLEGRACDVMARELGGPVAVAEKVDTFSEPLCLSGSLRIYRLLPLFRFDDTGDAKVVLSAAKDGRAFGCSWRCGKGRVVRLGAKWTAYNSQQIELVERLMGELGAKRVAKSSEPNVFHSTFDLQNGKWAVFVMNLRASEMSTKMDFAGGESKRFDLKPMEVSYLEF